MRGRMDEQLEHNLGDNTVELGETLYPELPQDILCLILPQLSLPDLVRSRIVCNSFRQVRWRIGL